MLILSLLFSFFINRAESGELLVVKSPPSVKFQGNEPLDQTLVPDLCSAAMGFTTQHEHNWNGMTIIDPFNFAQAVIILYVDGISTLGNFQNLQKYVLNNNEDESTTWNKIQSTIFDRFPMENNTVVKLDLSTGEGFHEIKTTHLNIHIEEDAAFLKEIYNLNKYLQRVKKSDGVPDLIWFSLNTLHSISDLKGSHHSSTVEAKEIVYESLLKIGKTYNAAYEGQVLVLGIISDASHTRRTRSVAEEKQNLTSVINLKDNIYDTDFPVIFNIILWFTVAFVFTLLAVSVFIASMDPGRDSIIYRMTSNRMKKDS